jgi:predicted nuclease with TOPRIM domain
MTADINPGCLQHFSSLEQDLAELKEALNGQGKNMAELTTGAAKLAVKVDQHEGRIVELEAGHKGLVEKVSSIEISMSAMLKCIEAIQVELARLNTWQTRLIFLLVGALIVMALGAEGAKLMGAMP